MACFGSTSKLFFIAVKDVFWLKIAILHILDCFEDHATKKEKIRHTRRHKFLLNVSGVQISFRRLTKVGVSSKFWLKLTDVKRHCRKIGHLSTT